MTFIYKCESLAVLKNAKKIKLKKKRSYDFFKNYKKKLNKNYFSLKKKNYSFLKKKLLFCELFNFKLYVLLCCFIIIFSII